MNPQFNQTWNDHFERRYKEQSPHLDVLCATLDPLAFMRLRKGLISKDHVEEATKAVHCANFWCQHMLGAEANPTPPVRSFKDMPLVYDTGASRGLTPFRRDFIDY